MKRQDSFPDHCGDDGSNQPKNRPTWWTISVVLVALFSVSAMGAPAVALSADHQNSRSVSTDAAYNGAYQTAAYMGSTNGSGESDRPDGATNRSSDPHPKIADGTFSSDGSSSSEDSDGVSQSSSGGTAQDLVTLRVRSDNVTARRATAQYVTAELSGTIRTEFENKLVVSVAEQNVTDLANQSTVAFIRRPVELEQSGGELEPTGDGEVVSSGIDTIGSDARQARNQRGQNITVAVMDFGFNTSNPEISDDISRTRNYTPDSFEKDGTHGTAVAEIVTDTAPGANLTLIKVQTGADIVQATRWAANQSEIDIITYSLGTAGARLDGKDAISNASSYAVSKGKPVVVSAGNSGDSHWNGSWNDPDGDRYLEYRSNRDRLRIDASGAGRITVQWDDYPATSENYDIYLTDGSTTVASSETVQDGSQPPIESLSVPSSGTYYLYIYNRNAAGTSRFNVFGTDSLSIPNGTRTQSLVVPATGPSVISVGAYSVDTETLEPFSSAGPTVDGRRGLDVLAPDRVQTLAYQRAGFPSFPGTSAASPHVSGVIAQMLGENESLSYDRLRSRINRTAVTFTAFNDSSSPDPIYGHGSVNAYGAVPPIAPNATDVEVAAVNRSNVDSVPVNVTYPYPPLPGNTYVNAASFNASGGTTKSVVNLTSTNTSRWSTLVRVNLSGARVENGEFGARAAAVNNFEVSNPEGYTATSTGIPMDTVRPEVVEARTNVSIINDSATENSIIVTVQFDEAMDDTTAPTVTLSTPADTYTVDSSQNASFGWVNNTSWRGEVTVSDNDTEGQATVTVTDTNDTVGNPLNTSGTRNEVAAVTVDTANPQNPSLNVIETAPISATNVTAVSAAVTFDSPPEAGMTELVFSGPNGTSVRHTASLNTSSTTTVVENVNLSALDVGTVTMESAVTDTAGNRNPGNLTNQSSGVFLDDTVPRVSNVRASNPSTGTLRVRFDATETVEEIAVNVSGAESFELAASNFTYQNGTYTTEESVQEGNYTVTFQRAEDRAGNADTTSQTVSTSVGNAPDPDGDGTPATDPDGDGEYEDINGDGSFDINDVGEFFDIYTNTDDDRLDFTGDGSVNINDVGELFDQV